MDKYFTSLWLSLCLAAGAQALLCYWCSGVGDDRECENHPYAVRTGPIYIDCRSRYCITAKVIDALTGKVQSFARLCDNISRGNQCVRDSRLVTCYESCTSDLCNNGNPSPEYLDTVNYASYGSVKEKGERKKKTFVPTEMGEDFQHDEERSIAAYKGLTEERVAIVSAAAARHGGTDDSNLVEDKSSQKHHFPTVPSNQKHSANDVDHHNQVRGYERKPAGMTSVVPSSPFVPKSIKRTTRRGEEKQDDGVRITEHGERSDHGRKQTKNKRIMGHLPSTQEAPRTVMDQHPTVYLSTVNSVDAGKDNHAGKVTRSSEMSASTSTRNPEANMDPSPTFLTPSAPSVDERVKASPRPSLSPEGDKHNGDDKYPNLAPHVTMQPTTSFDSQRGPDVVTSLPHYSSASEQNYYDHMAPVNADYRYTQPPETFMTNIHMPMLASTEAKLFPVDPATVRTPAYLYPIDDSTQIQDPRYADYQTPIAEFGTPQINVNNQYKPDPVLSSHRERPQMRFEPSFSQFRPQPNLYSALHLEEGKPAFFSEAAAGSPENGQGKFAPKGVKAESLSLIQPTFEDDSNGYGDGNDITKVLEENEAAFVEAGYRLDSLDELVAVFRQHPENRYPIPTQQPTQTRTSSRDNPEQGRSLSPESSSPTQTAGQVQNEDSNQTESNNRFMLPAEATLKEILEETLRQTGGIFIPSSRTRTTSGPPTVGNIFTPPPVTKLDRSILITDAPSKFLDEEHKFSRKPSRKNRRPPHRQHGNGLTEDDEPENEKLAGDVTTQLGRETTVSRSQVAPTTTTSSTAHVSSSAQSTLSDDATTIKVTMTSDQIRSSRMASNDVAMAKTTKPSHLHTTVATNTLSSPSNVSVTPTDDANTLNSSKTVTFPWNADAEKNATSTESSITIVMSFVNPTRSLQKPKSKNGNILSSASPSTTHQHASSDEIGISFATEAPRILFTPPSTATSSHGRTSGIPDTTLDAFKRRSQARGTNVNMKRTELPGNSASASSRTMDPTPSYAASTTSSSTQPHSLLRNNSSFATTTPTSAGVVGVIREMNTSKTTPSSMVSDARQTPSPAAESAKGKATQNMLRRPNMSVLKPSGPTLASLNSEGQVMSKWGHVHSEDVESSKSQELSAGKHVVILGVFSGVFVKLLRHN